MGAQAMRVETLRVIRPVAPILSGPVVVAVRGPSRSGKTALVERLIEEGKARGWKVAWVKRTHHQIDLPEKASGRVWSSGPAAMVLHADDRVQVTMPAAPAETGSELLYVPEGMDLILLETHTPEGFPTLLSNQLQPADGRMSNSSPTGHVPYARRCSAWRSSASTPSPTRSRRSPRTLTRTVLPVQSSMNVAATLP